jgi:hypothetical protein
LTTVRDTRKEKKKRKDKRGLKNSIVLHCQDKENLSGKE